MMEASEEKRGTEERPGRELPVRGATLTALVPARRAGTNAVRGTNGSQGTNALVRTYEELDGAQGRAVFFRPHRHTAEDLAPLRCSVLVHVEDAERECALRDVSQSGVAFEWPAEIPVHQGQRLRLALRFDDHEAWRGEARISSDRERDGVVGASFENALLDTDELLDLRNVLRWGNDGSLEVGGKPWNAPGNHEYKALVAELRLLLEETEEQLGEMEKTLPWHVMQDPNSLARTALMRRLDTEIGGELRRVLAAIDAARRRADPADQNGLMKFSQRQVDRFVMKAPCLHRARQKPFGYPGDYELMNYFYEKDFEGATLFGRLVGYSFLQTPVALAVRYRKDMMRRQLLEILARRASSEEPVRFLSIASGPAAELRELLAEVEELRAPLEIVLFDQDKGALAHAFRRLRPLADARFPGRVRIVFLNESIKRLLRDDHLFDAFGGFDAVYSCGLFDYLQDATAVRLARNLHAAAAPGGHVFIGNMVDHHHRWMMEHLLEWNLRYRTREELLDIGRRATHGARLGMLEEPTGVNPFIDIERD
jgi:extracellular factor (EF) 3-hydroxypalmitic acid methyl ester biosynthesis protein